MSDEEGKDKAPEVNAFGEPVTPQGDTEHDDTNKGEGGEGEGKKVEKKFENIPEDHPVVVGLKKQIEDVKKEYGTNLSGQRDVIKTLEGKIDALTKGTGGAKEEDKDVLHKDIKRSKDLKQEERDAMTETEIKQMDELADLKEAQNKMYKQMNTKAKTDADTVVEDRNRAVRDVATRLAKESSGKEDTELANKIIEAFGLYDQSKITAAQVEEFVKKAAATISTYKMPGQQRQTRGGAVKQGGTGETQDIDKIVEEAHKAKEGGHFAL